MPHARPIPPDNDMTQEEQAALIADTVNGPTEPDEMELLRQMFGEPDTEGRYGPPRPREGDAS